MYTGRPDKPLVVKCTFNETFNKKISFASARNCTYDILKAKAQQCFSLRSAPEISYKDDDGEVTLINTNEDLTEAISYFQAGSDDAPTSSAASILSGRSFGRSKIVLRVEIGVPYDGPSLSDTSSLASREEYKDRNESRLSFSFSASPSAEYEDDSVTVSSRDTGAGFSSEVQRSRPPDIEYNGSSYTSGSPPQLPSPWETESSASWAQSVNAITANGSNGQAEHLSSRDEKTVGNGVSPFDDRYHWSAASRFPENPSGVFEQLKLNETVHDTSNVDYEPSAVETDRGVAWLRDQNARTIKSLLGALPAPSESDGDSMARRDSDPRSGDLALEQDPRGKYYYSYTSVGSSGASQAQDYGFEETPSVNGAIDPSVEGNEQRMKPRPTSMQLNWLASQQIPHSDHHPSEPFASRSLPRTSNSDPLPVLREHVDIDSTIPPEVLQFVTVTGPPPNTLTGCSECGVLLDSIRYVCSTCGEKKPAEWLINNTAKGKGKNVSSESDFLAYPPPRHRGSSSSPAMSSRTVVGETYSSPNSSSSSLSHIHKPLPSLPTTPSSERTLATSPRDPFQNGYELCSGCIESAGVHHALEVNLAPGSSTGSPGSLGRGNSSPSSPEDTQRALSQWRRTAPGKGKLRHGYLEKVWGHRGWEDVEQDELHNCRCSTCNTVIINNRYKCASCQKFNLCLACYSQVHEIHPSHAFLVVPDKPVRSRSNPDLLPVTLQDNSDEQSMTHSGVKCAHCMLDIVGARFHCAVCESIDICSNCESAGLPGNLDSSDGGHNSSHIMIKIPYPLETTEVQNASRRAINLWTGRDAERVAPRSKPSSVVSSYARTVVGSGSRDPDSPVSEDHHLFCKGCSKPIIGIRYQCASCPSLPQAYSLCSSCEPRSYMLHDPMHVFFKLHRPVQKPIESAFPMLPKLYKVPAGPPPGAINPTDPRDYLKTVHHSSALCDRCMTRIEGEWFRCAYCSKDLCDGCEAIDTHDDTHVFLVFKSPVDMQIFRVITDLDNPPPVIPYPVYR